VADFGEITVVDRLAGMVEMLITRGDKKLTIPIESKILLTLDEAQVMTRLSKRYLRQAINQGNLKAKQIGKSCRVKRSDLNKFVDELFKQLI